MMRILLVAIVLGPTCSAARAETIAGRATVIDGDTLEIHGERIRILDVDAPESRQTCIRPAQRIGMEVRAVGRQQAGGLDRHSHRDLRGRSQGSVRPMAGALRCRWREDMARLARRLVAGLFPIATASARIIRARSKVRGHCSAGIWAGDFDDAVGMAGEEQGQLRWLQ